MNFMDYILIGCIIIISLFIIIISLYIILSVYFAVRKNMILTKKTHTERIKIFGK